MTNDEFAKIYNELNFIYQGLTPLNIKPAIGHVWTIKENELQKLQTEIKELTRQRDLYKKSNDFYADAIKWRKQNQSAFTIAIGGDVEYIPERDAAFGGKYARKIQKEVEDG